MSSRSRKRGNPLTTILVILMAVLLLIVFGLMNIGLLVAWGIQLTVWTGMETLQLWTLGFIFSLVLYVLFWWMTYKAESKRDEPAEMHPALSGFIAYATLNVGSFLVMVVVYVLVQPVWLWNFFTASFPFLE